MKRAQAIARLERRRRAHGEPTEARKLPGSMKKPYPRGRRR